jgi:Gas vesicle synthesis protein GvpL/GvpF
MTMSSYVYCVTRASHPLPLEAAVGVGRHAPALRLVREQDLVAVVSDAPESLRAKRRDLVKHDAVVGRMHAAGTVLPMRFGMVAPDDEAVRTELRSGARRYGELLSRIDGHVELNVKGVHAEEALLRDVLLRNDALRARAHTLRAADGGGHQDKVAFGEHVAAAVAERGARDAAQVIARLQSHAAQVRRGPPVDGCFVNASFLVASGARPDFDGALSRLRRELPGYASVESYGPLPPYSFVVSEAGG